MPFESTSATDQKLQFISEWSREEIAFSQLCLKYGISRPTGYKWVERYKSFGAAGLEERSHEAHSQPNALDPNLEQMLLRARDRYPSWGPKKLIAWIREKEGLERVCALSTANEILKRHGLVSARKVTPRAVTSSEPLAAYRDVNAVWCVDYKGWFRLGNGRRCDPLTLTDGFSRYLLRCQAFERMGLETTRRVFDATFREYGLPERIRSDNGAPFGSVAIGGLSALAVWWIRLGIVPERIAPGRPCQNGRHERMHRTLKEALQPPGYDLRAQQRRFNAFRRYFNEERPHEALGQRTPQSFYEASTRPYPARIPEPEYEPSMETRKVQCKGEFKWKGGELFLSETLRGETIGLRAVSDGIWEIRFCYLVLGSLNERTMKIEPREKPRKRKRK